MELSTNFLQQLIAVQGVSSDESRIKSFIIDYIQTHESEFAVKPVIYSGDEFHDAFIVVFGEPKTAIYAHTDTIGYSVGYENELIKVGGPRIIDGTKLVGKDRSGDVAGELMVFESDEDGSKSIQLIAENIVDRGTLLSFAPNFRETETAIQSPYMDNRLGVFIALEVAKTLENGALVFSTYEEHGGNSVSACARFLHEKYNVKQALICDITWVTHGVVHGEGVAISLRDSMLPRKSYIDRIVAIAEKANIPYQLEVESAGGSDGSTLQKSELLIDWCFIGAPEDNVHTPDEIVYKNDIVSMIQLYQILMKEL
jgi:putative aminopeptidase FrvX